MQTIFAAHNTVFHLPLLNFALSALLLCVFNILKPAKRDPARDRELAKVLLAYDKKKGECERTEAQWQTLLEAVADPIFLIDSDGSCHPANVPAQNLFPTNKLCNLLTLTQSPELDALYHEAKLGEDDQGGQQVVRGEITIRRPAERVMRVAIHPVVHTHASGDESETEPSFIIILHDLTDLRRLETVRRDFVANVSHELRTPLSSVKAMAETLLDGALEDPSVAHNFLETIIRESDRLVRLSEDLLDLSRVESRPVAKTLTDLMKLGYDVAARHEVQSKDAGITLIADLASPLIAPCAPDEIAQVLVNLIDNAIKYTPKGGTVWLKANDEPSEVVFSVQDTGIGIMRQDIPRLFERFYRADKARSRASGGTGLGLAIVKHIVERHGGRVWVESQYNRGSTFWFSIPKE